MKRRFLFIFLIVFSFVACKDKPKDSPTTEIRTHKYTKFNGSYKTFNDLHDLHMSAAQAKGITPMDVRADTTKYLNKLVRLPDELDLYKLDKLTHSVPYVVEDASKLIMQIGANFSDSLRRKKMPQYKIIITSVTRSQDDVARLTKRNYNASENSTHCYGTTFDISWKRFEKKGPKDENDVSPDRLKYVLAQVLHDLRQQDLCYIMHERKQACFHITVR